MIDKQSGVSVMQVFFVLIGVFVGGAFFLDNFPIFVKLYLQGDILGAFISLLLCYFGMVCGALLWLVAAAIVGK